MVGGIAPTKPPPGNRRRGRWCRWALRDGNRGHRGTLAWRRDREVLRRLGILDTLRVTEAEGRYRRADGLLDRGDLHGAVAALPRGPAIRLLPAYTRELERRGLPAVSRSSFYADLGRLKELAVEVKTRQLCHALAGELRAAAADALSAPDVVTPPAAAQVSAVGEPPVEAWSLW